MVYTRSIPILGPCIYKTVMILHTLYMSILRPQLSFFFRWRLDVLWLTLDALQSLYPLLIMKKKKQEGELKLLLVLLSRKNKEICKPFLLHFFVLAKGGWSPGHIYEIFRLLFVVYPVLFLLIIGLRIYYRLALKFKSCVIYCFNSLGSTIQVCI